MVIGNILRHTTTPTCNMARNSAISCSVSLNSAHQDVRRDENNRRSRRPQVTRFSQAGCEAPGRSTLETAAVGVQNVFTDGKTTLNEARDISGSLEAHVHAPKREMWRR
ncbi:hypothetical protein E2C01_033607 [Portunus trituberculatus]|uniref:Uncharacterized protein n=1 Tax=Portunus trituberculatus TaxID=210409 RepID=A0A5B7F636_PORTR|nr:hypothetical protein [Portunus trituberculatus]